MVFLGTAVVVLAIFFFLPYRIKQAHAHKKIAASRNPSAIGFEYEDVFFPTVKSLKLHGWFVPLEGGDGRTAVLMHGWSRNAERMLDFVPLCRAAGFHCLLIDARNHGESDDDGYSSMPKYTEDIGKGIDYLVSRGDVNSMRIGVMGHSIGGAASIYRASLDVRIKWVVSLAAFAHPDDPIRTMLYSKGLKSEILFKLAVKYIEFRIGKSFDDIAPENNIGRIRGSVMLVHGTADKVIGVEHMERLAARADPELTDILYLEGGNHSNMLEFPEFREALTEFLKQQEHISIPFS